MDSSNDAKDKGSGSGTSEMVKKRSWLFLLIWIGVPLLLVILVVLLGDAC